MNELLDEELIEWFDLKVNECLDWEVQVWVLRSEWKSG